MVHQNDDTFAEANKLLPIIVIHLGIFIGHTLAEKVLLTKYATLAQL